MSQGSLLIEPEVSKERGVRELGTGSLGLVRREWPGHPASALSSILGALCVQTSSASGGLLTRSCSVRPLAPQGTSTPAHRPGRRLVSV